MKILSKMLAVVFLLPFFMSAQDDADKKYTMVELSYMKAKIGSEKKFEDAVKAHNEKYHKEGAYGSQLYAITTGSETGWYVWTMGSVTFAELDSRPKDEDHNKDWDKNVAPYVADYGRVEYWKRDDKLSNPKESEEGLIQIWWIDTEDGEYYRFKSIMQDVADIYKTMDEEMNTYNNAFSQDDGRDVAVVWPLKNWADLDNRDWNMKEKYEEENGEGSWENLIDDWEDATKSIVQEIWRVVK